MSSDTDGAATPSHRSPKAANPPLNRCSRPCWDQQRGGGMGMKGPPRTWTSAGGIEECPDVFLLEGSRALAMSTFEIQGGVGG